MTERGADACPAEILEWIAWYPDGGLTPEQRGAVEAHAATCSACRDELAVLAGRSEAPVAPADPERLFARVLALVEAEELAGSAPTTPLVERAPEWPATAFAASAPVRQRGVRPGGGRARLAAAAAGVLALGALAGWLGRDLANPTDAAVYVAASETLPAAGEVPALDVVFRSDATAERIQTALRGLGGELVAGPTPLGRYRVELPAGADASAAAALLRAEGTGVASYAQPVRP